MVNLARVKGVGLSTVFKLLIGGGMDAKRGKRYSSQVQS